MPVIQTPGVYIVDKNAFPDSVVEVASAVPAFVGYTRRCSHAGASLLGKPWRIGSMAEYLQYFGGGPDVFFSIDEHADGATPPDFVAGAGAAAKGYDLTQPASKAGGCFLLHRALQHFFMNGGGPCYVVSVGGFDVDVAAGALTGGIDELVDEPEPTLLVIPDAMLLSQADCSRVQQAMLAHCGGRMLNRFALLDVWSGWRGRQDPAGDPVAGFGRGFDAGHLSFGAAYYPWLHSDGVQANELGHRNVLNASKLAQLIGDELGLPATVDDTTPKRLVALAKRVAGLCKTDAQWAAEVVTAIDDPGLPADAKARALEPEAVAQAVAAHQQQLDSDMTTLSPLFKTIMQGAARQLNLLPPSPAMAGVYTTVDSSRGVWHAPAGVSLNGVVEPAVHLADEEIEDRVGPQGLPINPIRTMAGLGVLVWGARTLDGNREDWRYVQTRRTMIMIEQSCSRAVQALRFEPHVAATWQTAESAIAAYLTSLWKRGGLAGALPQDAFSVTVGLGSTMTAEDVLAGILRVSVRVAVTRPGEFIAIAIEQRMQAA